MGRAFLNIKKNLGFAYSVKSGTVNVFDEGIDSFDSFLVLIEPIHIIVPSFVCPYLIHWNLPLSVRELWLCPS